MLYQMSYFRLERSELFILLKHDLNAFCLLSEPRDSNSLCIIVQVLQTCATPPSLPDSEFNFVGTLGIEPRTKAYNAE